MIKSCPSHDLFNSLFVCVLSMLGIWNISAEVRLGTCDLRTQSVKQKLDLNRLRVPRQVIHVSHYGHLTDNDWKTCRNRLTSNELFQVSGVRLQGWSSQEPGNVVGDCR